MFDWNDEELANIVWDEGGEDHIVPHPDENNYDHDKKDQNVEVADTKGTAQKTGKHDFLDLKLGSTSNFGKHGKSSSVEFIMDAWLDMSPDSVKTDQESKNSEVADDVSETKYYLAKGEKHNDFLGYGWENIGSFDDLDQIFGLDEPLFSDVLDNANELWSSKDVADSSIRSFSLLGSPSLCSEALTDNPEILILKSGIGLQDDPSLKLAYGKFNNPTSLSFPFLDALKNQGTFPVGGVNIGSSHLVAGSSGTDKDSVDKVSTSKKQQKEQIKSIGKTNGKSIRDSYGALSSSGNSSQQYTEHLQLAPPMVQFCAPLATSQMRQIQGATSFHCQHISSPCFYNPAFGNVASPGSVAHSSLAKYKGQTASPPTMTPQEKIEKLRRRQQMQALLGIQKQQEQFSQQDDYSISQKYPAKRTDFILDDSNLHSSAVEQDDSDWTSGVVIHHAAEEIVLSRLKDVISTLDSSIRLCIRDSLLRLAISAVQRHCTSDNNSVSATQIKDEKETMVKEDTVTDNRVLKMLKVEAKTNPIDRVVAHLLFHSPLDSKINHSSTPPSPIYAKHPPTENSRPSSSGNLPSRALPELACISYQGPKSPGLCKDSPLQIDSVKTSPLEGTPMDMKMEASL